MKKFTSASVALAILCGGCSSKPRQFVMLPAAPQQADAQFISDDEHCRQMVAAGKRSDFGGRVLSGAGGVAAGAGTGALLMGGAGTSMAATAGAAAVAVVAMPLMLVGGTWGLAKLRKNKKEHEVRDAMARCMAEYGHPQGAFVAAGRKATAQDVFDAHPPATVPSPATVPAAAQ